MRGQTSSSALDDDIPVLYIAAILGKTEALLLIANL